MSSALVDYCGPISTHDATAGIADLRVEYACQVVDGLHRSNIFGLVSVGDSPKSARHALVSGLHKLTSASNSLVSVAHPLDAVHHPLKPAYRSLNPADVALSSVYSLPKGERIIANAY